MANTNIFVPIKGRGGAVPEYGNTQAPVSAGSTGSARLEGGAVQIANAYNLAHYKGEDGGFDWAALAKAAQAGQGLVGTAQDFYDKRSRAYVDEAVLRAREEMEAWRTDYDQTHQGQNGLQAAADYQKAWARISDAHMKGLRKNGVNGPYERLAFLHLRENGLHYGNQGVQFQKQQDKVWNTSIFEGEKSSLLKEVRNDPDNALYQGFLTHGVLESYKRLHPGENTSAFEAELRKQITKERLNTYILCEEYGKARLTLSGASGGSSYGGIGALAVGHESGGDPGKVSPDTSGSYSYGLFQFNSKPGGTAHSFMPFLQKNHPKLYAALGNGYLKVGSKEFNQVFHDVANGEMKDEMIMAQQEHLYAEYAAPVEKKLGGTEFQKKFDNNRGYKEVLLSTAIQHGPDGAARIMREAWGKVDKNADPQTQLEQFIHVTYQLRGRSGEFKTALSEKEGEAAKEKFMAGLRGRYAKEEAQALEMARGGSVSSGQGQGGKRPEMYVAYDNPEGMTEKGNIDIANRPQVKNADGSISTVRSMSFEIDGKQVLVPTVSEDGKILSEKEAVDEYVKSGKHLGIFDSVDHANTYAQKLHKQQEKMYLREDKSGGAVSNIPDLSASETYYYKNMIKAGEMRKTENQILSSFAGNPQKGLKELSTPEGWAKYGLDATQAEKVIKLLQTQWTHQQKVEKQQRENYESRVYTDAVNIAVGAGGQKADPVKAYQMIAEDQILDGESKMKALKAIREGMIDKDDPAYVVDIKNRIAQGAVVPDSELARAMAAGQLSSKTKDQLLKMRDMTAGPQGEIIKAAFNAMNDAYKKSMMADGTPEQAQAHYAALHELQTTIDQAKANGTVMEILNPSSPKYVLPAIMQRHQLTMRDQVDALQNRVKNDLNPNKRLPNETPQEYLKRRNGGK